MKKKSVVIAGFLAVVVTAALFLAGGPGGSGPNISGRMSKEAIEVEAAYKQLQEQWRKYEAQFRTKGEFPLLARLNKSFAELAPKAAALKGDSDAERAALPHLVKSIEESAQVPTAFMMMHVNEKLVDDAHWAAAKTHAEAANREWKEWAKRTEGLSR